MGYTRAKEELHFHLKILGICLKMFGWHSMRRGGVTKAANSGVAERLLKKHGRCKSNIAKDGYIEENLSSKISVTRNLA